MEKKIKEVVVSHKGYTIRKLGEYIIAIPHAALCFAHEIQEGERVNTAVRLMKELIDENVDNETALNEKESNE